MRSFIFDIILSYLMVVGSIEERIKKMKEAILSEANERAATIVKNADDEASN